MDDIMIVGTDTGVGKSVVSLLLIQLLYGKGYRPFYLKPFQTGCTGPGDRDSDAAFVYRHTAALRGENPAPSVIYCHPSAKAPFFAARDVGTAIDPDHLCKAVERIRSNSSPLVVEAAGGLMVPVTASVTVMDVIPMLQCRTLLVARAGLGTINHTLLSIDALLQRAIEIAGVVFVESAQDPADPALVQENMEAVATFSGIQVSGVVPVISDFHRPSLSAYAPLEGILFKP